MAVWPWIAALALAAFLGGVGTGWALLAHVAYVLAALDLAALGLVAAGRRGLRVTGTVDRTRLTAGEAVVETCTIEKRSVWPAVWLDVEWANGDVQSLALPGCRARVLAHEWHMPHRGRYAAGGGRVSVRDPLGLMVRTGALAAPVPVTVYPRPLPVPEAAAAVRALVAREDRRRPDALDETLGGLRDYVAGDPLSRIHWRTTARRGVLTVMDLESRHQSAIWLLVDLGGDEENVEETAGVAAYLAAAFQGLRRPVGAIVGGESLAALPGRAGHDGAGRILTVLAEMPSAPAAQMEAVLRAAGQVRNPGCFVVVSASGTGGGLNPARQLKTIHPQAEVVLAVPRKAAA